MKEARREADTAGDFSAGALHLCRPKAIVLVGERALLAPDTGLKYGNEPIYAERPCKWIMVEKIIA
ncbi:hypothetical protein [Duganella sp. LjRoot269]|uniref:hypothetical protein n=1 Tax=Duganella sp. LjRoot269 TaxID=3342305 RepID=UPI003ED0E50F